MHPHADQNSERHHADYRHDGEHHSLGAAFQRRDDVHAESKSDHRSLKKIFRAFLIEFRKRHGKYQREHESGEKRKRGSYEIRYAKCLKGEGNQHDSEDVDVASEVVHCDCCNFF